MSGRFDRAVLAIILALAVAGVIIIAGQTRSARLSSDFTIDYSAGLLLREGRMTAPYDQEELVDTMHRVAPDGSIDPRLIFNKPLAAALPAALLSLLPLELAFRAWQLISAGLLLLTLVILRSLRPLGHRALSLGVIGVVAAVPTWATFTEGQVTPLLALGAALAIAGLRSKKAVVALAAGALLAVKPQYVPAYLAVLLAARAWRPFLAAGLGGTIILLSPLVGGWNNLVAMGQLALAANRVVDVRLDESWIGVVGSLLPLAALTGLAIAIFVVVQAGLWSAAWRRPTNSIAFAALAGTLTVLASPHTLPHDLLILAAPAWLALALYRDGALANPIPAFVLVDLALVIDLRGIGVPLAPMVITAVLGWMLWQFRQRAASRRQPPVVQAA